MKKINRVLIILSCILSVAYTLASRDSDLYRNLIRLSLILVVFVPNILRKFKINISEASETIYLIFVLTAHFLGSIVNLYDKIYWYDTFCHFISGTVISFFILEFIIKSKFKLNKMGEVLFIISLSSLIATSWEIFEYVSDNLFDKDAQKVLTTGVDDTMQDMIVALLGSILFNICYMYEYLNDKKLIVTNFIKSIKK